jgi:hypothetical protein
MSKKTTGKDLIKWAQLSKKLSGSDNSIRPNRIPKKYKHKVEKLLKAIEYWSKWAEKND